MSVGTESLIKSECDRVKAESDTEFARALLTLQETIHRETRWTIGVILAAIAIASTVIGLLVAN